MEPDRLTYGKASTLKSISRFLYPLHENAWPALAKYSRRCQRSTLRWLPELPAPQKWPAQGRSVWRDLPYQSRCYEDSHLGEPSFFRPDAEALRLHRGQSEPSVPHQVCHVGQSTRPLLALQCIPSQDRATGCKCLHRRYVQGFHAEAAHPLEPLAQNGRGIVRG